MRETPGERESRFINHLRRAAERLRKHEPKSVEIWHHDDGDGLASGAICRTLFQQAGFETRLICIEKIFPEVVSRSHSRAGRLIVYSDIGSPHARLISERDRGQNLVLFLDHHDAEPVESDDLIIGNPELFGLSGERDASASTVAYLFSKEFSPRGEGLARLAVIGSAEIPGDLVSLNKIALEDASRLREISVRRSAKGEDYVVSGLGRAVSYRTFSSKLTILGSVGYYENGPERAVEACLGGISAEIQSKIDQLEEKRKRANKDLLSKIRADGLSEMERVQWFHAGEIFKGMGTKTIGSFCSYLKYQGILHPLKYLVGFMNVEPEVPNFGRLKGMYVKASARLPTALEEKVKAASAPPVSALLSQAAKMVDGLGDGHTFAASGVIPKGKENEFLGTMDQLAKGASGL